MEHNVVHCYGFFASHILNVFNETLKNLEENNVTFLDVYNIMDTWKTSQEDFNKNVNTYICFIGKAIY